MEIVATKNQIIKIVKEVITLCEGLRKPVVISLNGELGVGKTFFVRSMLQYLSTNEHLKVQSPTFTLMNEYHFSNTSACHIDFFRITESDKNLEAVLNSYQDYDWCLVEWLSLLDKNIGFLLPDISIDILYDSKSQTKRLYKITKMPRTSLFE